MTNKLIIYGGGNIAELAHYYFRSDSDYDVIAFCVDQSHYDQIEFSGLPVVTFEEVEQHFSPAEHNMFVAFSYSKINQVRDEKYVAAKNKGYQLVSYISSKATVLNDHAIGENAFILEDNTIQPFVKIGNNVTLWSGNHIGHHSTINDHCFISSHVVVSGGVKIGSHCFLGVNATIRDHVTIGPACVVGAGALILADAEAFGVYIGDATERSRVPSHKLRKI
jgi:sugar O-acyltransferase (sialic acid O-acetyltransferase NeuD family)